MVAKYEIEKFKGRNFSLWKLKMKAILRKDNCLAAISGRLEEFTNDNKWNEMDENIVADLHLALADEISSSVQEKKLQKRFGTSSLDSTRPSQSTIKFSLRGSFTLFG